MYEESPVNVKVEGGSTFMFKRNFLFIASISFSHVNFTRKRTYKLRDKAVEIHLNLLSRNLARCLWSSRSKG